MNRVCLEFIRESGKFTEDCGHRAHHEAILKGNSEEALRLLQAHQRQFPSGVMRQERDAASIVASCRLGRKEQASEQWARFAATWPGSPLTERIRTNCHWPEHRSALSGKLGDQDPLISIRQLEAP